MVAERELSPIFVTSERENASDSMVPPGPSSETVVTPCRTRPGWRRTTAIMLSYQLGLGVLALPYVATMLGWIPFLASFVTFTMGTAYSGLLFARLYQVAPKSKILADVARRLPRDGALAARIVDVTLVSFLVAVAPLIQLTLTISVETLMHKLLPSLTWMPTAAWAWLVGAVALVLSQPREMNSVGLLGLIGAIAILIPCVGIVMALLLGGSAPVQPGNGTASSALVVPTALVEDRSTVVQRISAVMSICYAYGGQNIFCELQVEPRRSDLFSRPHSILSLHSSRPLSRLWLAGGDGRLERLPQVGRRCRKHRRFDLRGRRVRGVRVPRQRRAVGRPATDKLYSGQWGAGNALQRTARAPCHDHVCDQHQRPRQERRAQACTVARQHDLEPPQPEAPGAFDRWRTFS